MEITGQKTSNCLFQFSSLLVNFLYKECGLGSFSGSVQYIVAGIIITVIISLKKDETQCKRSVLCSHHIGLSVNTADCLLVVMMLIADVSSESAEQQEILQH